MESLSGFLRHIDACQRVRLPRNRRRFLIGAAQVGWLAPTVAAALALFPGVRAADEALVLDDPAALPGIAERLADQGLFRWRGEAFDVRAEPDGPALAQIDRGALPALGIAA